jgi:hypothetical protein
LDRLTERRHARERAAQAEAGRAGLGTDDDPDGATDLLSAYGGGGRSGGKVLYKGVRLDGGDDAAAGAAGASSSSAGAAAATAGTGTGVAEAGAAGSGTDGGGSAAPVVQFKTRKLAANVKIRRRGGDDDDDD